MGGEGERERGGGTQTGRGEEEDRRESAVPEFHNVIELR